MTLAVVFPGQGSQSVGMLAELYDDFTLVRDLFAEATATLGYDLWHIISTGPKEKLDQTEITQPAMLCAGVAVYRVVQQETTIKPEVLAGHSLGEYSALVAAGALSFTDALKLVRERACLMQQAVPEGKGAMAAILGLDDDTVRTLCAETDGIVEAVNFNSPGQVVIAGETAAVTTACEKAKQAGAKRALVLPVSVPSHSSLMQPAAEQFATVLADINITPPTTPVINNVDCDTATDPEQIRSALVRQLHNPVRWVETIQAMSARGVSDIIEAGSGKVLTGLNKRCDKTLSGIPVFDRDSLTLTRNSHS
jgi:[acyl-carrier-protein] S-malonyltransferase